MLEDDDGRRARDLPVHTAPREPPLCCVIWMLFSCMVVPALLFAGAIYILVDQTFYQEPHYSVAIDSVSGLDPVFSGRPALHPEFNLTFRVASHGFWIRECAEYDMHVEVSYHGVPLASSMTPAKKICARPRNVADRSVVARGAGVVVPGSLLDCLAGDMRDGVQVFDVAFRGVGKHVNYTCGPRRVGDDCARQTDCAAMDLHRPTSRDRP